MHTDDAERHKRLAATEQPSGTESDVVPTIQETLDELRAERLDYDEMRTHDLPTVTVGHPITTEDVVIALDEDSDWPDSDETVAILSDPDLVAAIEAGLADAAAGRVHTHDEVKADLDARQMVTGEHGEPITRVRLTNVETGLAESGTDDDLNLG